MSIKHSDPAAESFWNGHYAEKFKQAIWVFLGRLREFFPAKFRLALFAYGPGENEETNRVMWFSDLTPDELETVRERIWKKYLPEQSAREVVWSGPIKGVQIAAQCHKHGPMTSIVLDGGAPGTFTVHTYLCPGCWDERRDKALELPHHNRKAVA